jgi:hypothetical protein
MENCWRVDPEDRPTFREIFDRFRNHEIQFAGSVPAEIDAFLKQVRMPARLTAPLMPVGEVALPPELDTSCPEDPFGEAGERRLSMSPPDSPRVAGEAEEGPLAEFKQIMSADFEE